MSLEDLIDKSVGDSSTPIPEQVWVFREIDKELAGLVFNPWLGKFVRRSKDV
jgi:hypothetical protein